MKDISDTLMAPRNIHDNGDFSESTHPMFISNQHLPAGGDNALNLSASVDLDILQFSISAEWLDNVL